MIKVQYPCITSNDKWDVTIKVKGKTIIEIVTDTNHLNDYLITDIKDREYFIVKTSKPINKDRFNKFLTESSQMLTGFSMKEEGNYTIFKFLNGIEGMGVLQELESQSILKVKERIRGSNIVGKIKCLIWFFIKDKEGLYE